MEVGSELEKTTRGGGRGVPVPWDQGQVGGSIKPHRFEPVVLKMEFFQHVAVAQLFGDGLNAVVVCSGGCWQRWCVSGSDAGGSELGGG